MTTGQSTPKPITPAQWAALKWLNNRGGEGMFNKNGGLLAQGELAGVMRATWDVLADNHLLTFGKQKPKRVVITDLGETRLKEYTGPEASTVYEDDDYD